MDAFETFPEQDEAKRLLRAALAEGPAHAYLFHGPRGVGKRRAAFAFAAELLGDAEMIGIVKERLARPDAAKGYILDGFPRTVRQALPRHRQHEVSPERHRSDAEGAQENSSPRSDAKDR